MEKSEKDINIKDVLLAIRKRWLMIFAIILLSTSLVALYSFVIAEPVYSTTTKLFIGKAVTQGDDISDQYNVSEVTMFQKLMETYKGFAESSDLITRALNSEGIDKTSKEILKNFTVTTGQEDQFITFKYDSKDKEEGVKVLEAITSEFIDTTSKYIPNVTVAIVESPKYPQEPSSPNKIRNILLAVAFGVIVGIGVTFVLGFLDNTIKSKDEIEKLLEVPVIGIVPESSEDVNEIRDAKMEKNRRRGEYSA